LLIGNLSSTIRSTNKRVRDAVALDDAADDAAFLQERHFERCSGAFAGAPEKNASSGWQQDLCGFAKHPWKGRGIDRITDAAPGDGSNSAENVATSTVIDRVRRTELAGKRKPLLIYVYGNDGVTAGDLCCHKGR
jgi:hypothetical protein